MSNMSGTRPPHNRQGPLESTPVPPYVGSSVALDLFMMPKVKYEGEVFDCMILCVDRHSGLTIAEPFLREELIAKKWGQFFIVTGKT